MFKAYKIKRSLCLQSFLFLLIFDFFCDRYFFIIVPSFEFIIVFIGSFPVVFEKLFSHSNPLSPLINNLVYQSVRVLCSHSVKVNLDKRLVHLVSHLQSQQHVHYRSRICVHKSEKSSFFATRHSLLIFELPQEFISLVESCPPQPNKEDVV